MALQLNIGSLTSGSGIDVQSTVDQLMSLQKAPLTQMQQQQTNLTSETSALTDIQTKLQSLENVVQSLGDYTGSLAARTRNVITIQRDQRNGDIGCGHIAASDFGRSYGQSVFLVHQAPQRQPELVGWFVHIAIRLKTDGYVNVSSGDSLQTVANNINAKNAGITANVISDANGSRLTLIGNDTGTSNEIAVSSDSVGLGFQESSSAKDASLTVDGVLIDSASNTISTVIPGVTLSLTGSTTGTATLTVAADSSQAEQAVNSFVSAYNSAIQAISAQFTYDPTSKTAGPCLATVLYARFRRRCSEA